MKCDNCGFGFWPKEKDGYPLDRTQCMNCLDKAAIRDKFGRLVGQTIAGVQEDEGLWTIILSSGAMITAVDGEYEDNSFVITE